MTPAARRAASVARCIARERAGVRDRGGMGLRAAPDLDGEDRLALGERPIRQRQEPLRALEALDEQDNRIRRGIVEAGGEVVAEVEDHLRAAADDLAPADARAGMDERVGDAARLGDRGRAATAEVRRQVVDVGRAGHVEVEEAHAVRAQEGDAGLPRDCRDLALHGRGWFAALDHAAAGDDHRRHAGVRGLPDHGRGTQRVDRHDDDVRDLRERAEVRVGGTAVDLFVAGIHEEAAGLAPDLGDVVAHRARQVGTRRGTDDRHGARREEGPKVDLAGRPGPARRRPARRRVPRQTERRRRCPWPPPRSSDDLADAPPLEGPGDDQRAGSRSCPPRSGRPVARGGSARPGCRACSRGRRRPGRRGPRR